MLDLDLRTISLVVGSLAALHALVMVPYHLGAPLGRGPWALSALAGAAGLSLLLFRGILPPPAIVVLGATGLGAVVAQRLVYDLRAARAAGRSPLEDPARDTSGPADASRALLDVLVQRAPIGVGFLDRDMRIELANERLATFAGLSHAERAGHSVDTLLSATTAETIASLARRVLAAGAHEVIEVVEPESGPPESHRIWQVSAYPVSLRDRAIGVGVIVADVTAERHDAAALRDANLALETRVAERTAQLAAAHRVARERDELFQLTFEQSPIGVALIGLDYFFQQVNDALCRITGYTREELLRLDYPAITHPDDLALSIARLRALAVGRINSYTLENRYVRKDGCVVWVQLTVCIVHNTVARPLHYLTLVEDITDRKQAEERLRTIERQQQLILRTIPVHFWLKDVEGRYILASDALVDFHGRRTEDFIGQTADALYAPELAAFILAGDQKVRETGQVHYAEQIVVDHAGRQHWRDMTRAPVYDDDGTLIGITGVSQDFTARKQAEQALRRRIDELQVLNQISQALTTWTNVPAGLASVGAVMRQLFDAESIAVWTYAEHEAVLRQLITVEDGAADTLERRVQLAASPLAKQALGTTKTIVTVPSGDDPLLGGHPDLNGAARGLSILAVPLLSRNEPIGLLCIRAAHAGQIYTPNDVALAQTIAGVLASALANARLFADAQAAAAERERRRLARELHDSVSQALFAATRIAELLPQIWELDPDEGREALADLHRLTSASLAEMRALLIELRPKALIEAPLHEILGYLVPALAVRSTAQIDAILEPVPPLPPDVQVALYRITQEALNNVCKHAHARRVGVRLEACPPVAAAEPWQGEVTITVEDDGRGFDPASAGAGRLGLASIRERAADIGATIALASRPGTGTRLTVAWHTSTTELARRPL